MIRHLPVIPKRQMVAQIGQPMPIITRMLSRLEAQEMNLNYRIMW